MAPKINIIGGNLRSCLLINLYKKMGCTDGFKGYSK